MGDHDTDGHVDNLACFVAPGKVLLTWTDDPSDPQFEISREAEKALLSTLDARGRKIEVVKIPLPPKSCYTQKEIDSFYRPREWKAFIPTSLTSINLKSLVALVQGRRVGDRLSLSYVNFLICNGGIVAPSFGSDPEGLGGPEFEEKAKKTDAEAERILRECFPGPGGCDGENGTRDRSRWRQHRALKEPDAGRGSRRSRRSLDGRRFL